MKKQLSIYLNKEEEIKAYEILRENSVDVQDFLRKCIIKKSEEYDS